MAALGGKSSKARVEILSPAGDFICLDAALQAGADAVYFGLKGSNMRAGAKNFETKDMKKIVRKCSKFGAKAYLTLNTIYYEGEEKILARQLKAAKSAGVSAVIAWDLGAISLANEIGIPVHLSTQASAANSDAVASYARNYAIKRFVLARECSLESIAQIKKSLAAKLGKSAAKDISIEVFAHGAMCVSISGRCFLSQFSCGKSANRGECLQPCRREYLISDIRGGEPSFKIGSGYVMSPKDLCTLGFLEKLIDAGADSLKIEGRNRNAEYVFNVTSAYVKARDFYAENRKSPTFDKDFSELKNALVSNLESVFNRGFSSGFFMGKPVGDWTSKGNAAKSKKCILGHVLNFYSRLGVAEISIDDNSVSLGEEIQIEGETTGFVRMKIESMQLGGNPIDFAGKGMKVSVKVPVKLRRGDRIFKFL